MHFYKKDFIKCLEMFDNFVFSEDEFYLDFCNTSSLLLRLHYQGVDVEQRMRKLQPLANYFCEQQLIPFIDYHLILFLCRYLRSQPKLLVSRVQGDETRRNFLA